MEDVKVGDWFRVVSHEVGTLICDELRVGKAMRVVSVNHMVGSYRGFLLGRFTWVCAEENGDICVYGLGVKLEKVKIKNEK